MSATFVLNAWLSPDGKVHPVKNCGHSDYAFEELDDIMYGDVLERNGWMHLSANREKYVSNLSGHRPNQTQLDVLWDMYIDASNRSWKTPAMESCLESLQKTLNIKMSTERED